MNRERNLFPFQLADGAARPLPQPSLPLPESCFLRQQSPESSAREMCAPVCTRFLSPCFDGVCWISSSRASTLDSTPRPVAVLASRRLLYTDVRFTGFFTSCGTSVALWLSAVVCCLCAGCTGTFRWANIPTCVIPAISSFLTTCVLPRGHTRASIGLFNFIVVQLFQTYSSCRACSSEQTWLVGRLRDLLCTQLTADKETRGGCLIFAVFITVDQLKLTMLASENDNGGERGVNLQGRVPKSHARENKTERASIHSGKTQEGVPLPCTFTQEAERKSLFACK